MIDELSTHELRGVETTYFVYLDQWEYLSERFAEPALYHCEQDSRETERGRQLMLRLAKGEKLPDTHRLFSLSRYEFDELHPLVILIASLCEYLSCGVTKVDASTLLRFRGSIFITFNRNMAEYAVITEVVSCP